MRDGNLRNTTMYTVETMWLINNNEESVLSVVCSVGRVKENHKFRNEKWYRHVRRRDERATVKRISDWRSMDNRPRGRPRDNRT